MRRTWHEIRYETGGRFARLGVLDRFGGTVKKIAAGWLYPSGVCLVRYDINLDPRFRPLGCFKTLSEFVEWHYELNLRAYVQPPVWFAPIVRRFAVQRNLPRPFQVRENEPPHTVKATGWEYTSGVCMVRPTDFQALDRDTIEAFPSAKKAKQAVGARGQHIAWDE
ncbi:hypothetical protein [Longispora urticae]